LIEHNDQRERRERRRLPGLELAASGALPQRKKAADFVVESIGLAEPGLAGPAALARIGGAEPEIEDFGEVSQLQMRIFAKSISIAGCT
jgi:hypothetical protein